jgi:eukaryotic-like serine/threonine-protein kinase
VVDAAEIERLVMKPTARRRLGKYVLLGRLGAGGMGKIYLAYAPGPAGIEKFVVIKRLHNHLMGEQALVTSFLDEARLSMALSHPNIVHTYDVGMHDGRTYMVMEHIDGQNLGVLLRTAHASGAYPASALWAGLFTQVLDGLHAAHTAIDPRGRALEIIHRDVSPQNILITYDGVPKLVDFGIAKAQMRLSGTDAGTLKGKYAYMSPEQIRGEPLDARSDVFAAGIVLWEMLAGRRLYKADSVMRSVERILTEPLISPVRVNPSCEPTLAQVALRALEKERDARWSSALAMKDALDDALQAAGKRFRRGDLQALMEQLFGDAARAQRALVESCLLQAPIDGNEDDDDSRQGATLQNDRKRSSRSRASRSAPPSAASEATGPRVVHADDDVSDSAQLDTTPHRVRPESVAGRPGRTTPTGSLWVQPDGPTASVVVPPPPVTPATRAWVRWLPALLVPLFALTLWWWQRDRIPVGATDAPVDQPTDVASVRSLPPTDHIESVGTVGTVGTVATPSVVDAGPTLATDVGVSTDRPKRHPPRTERNDRSERGDRGERSDHDREPTRTPPVVEEPAERATGTLTLDTVPWTTVYLGKQKLGETPLVGVVVPAGAIELTLINQGAGIRESYAVTIKPGADHKKRLDLQ